MITPLTRRDLRELLGSTWRGRLSDVEFLSRLYDLEQLPSRDYRLNTMAEDIVQHRENNDDWEDDWIFSDDRLQLDDDERLLRLVAETAHPEVVRDPVAVGTQLAKVNTLLLPDGYELFTAGAMSGRPVFRWRRTTPRRPPQGPFPSSLIAGLGRIIVDLATSTGIDSMFEAEDFPPRGEAVGNKEEKVKAWLRVAQNDPNFDHWAGLARVLAPLLEPAEEGTQRSETQQRIREVLAKRTSRTCRARCSRSHRRLL
jgi:AbiJ-like protein